MLKINQIWNNILLETEAKVSTLQYDLYINQLQPVGIYRDRLILLAETRALKNIVDNNYKDVIKKCTNVVFPSIIDIEVITENDLDNVGKIEKEVFECTRINHGYYIRLQRAPIDVLNTEHIKLQKKINSLLRNMSQ